MQHKDLNDNSSHYRYAVCFPVVILILLLLTGRQDAVISADAAHRQTYGGQSSSRTIDPCGLSRAGLVYAGPGLTKNGRRWDRLAAAARRHE